MAGTTSPLDGPSAPTTGADSLWDVGIDITDEDDWMKEMHYDYDWPK